MAESSVAGVNIVEASNSRSARLAEVMAEGYAELGDVCEDSWGAPDNAEYRSDDATDAKIVSTLLWLRWSGS